MRKDEKERANRRRRRLTRRRREGRGGEKYGRSKGRGGGEG